MMVLHCAEYREEVETDKTIEESLLCNSSADVL